MSAYFCPLFYPLFSALLCYTEINTDFITNTPVGPI